MPAHVELTECDKKQLLDGGGLAPCKIKDKQRESKAFYDFILKNSEEKLEDLFKSDDGRNRFCDIFGEYFFSMRVQTKEGDVRRPKEDYASKLKSSIKTDY